MFEIDLAVVSAPDEQHCELGGRLLGRGIPTVIEKPLATSVDQILQLQRIAEANQAPVIAFQNRRWDADFLTALEVMRSGRLGDVIRFDSWLHRWAPGPWD